MTDNSAIIDLLTTIVETIESWWQNGNSTGKNR